MLQADVPTCGNGRLWDKETQVWLNLTRNQTCSTLTSYPAMTECCDKTAAHLRTAHKQKQVFQCCLFLPRPSLKKRSQAQALQEVPPAPTMPLTPSSASKIKPGSNLGGEGSPPVLQREIRPWKAAVPLPTGLGKPSPHGTAGKQ